MELTGATIVSERKRRFSCFNSTETGVARQRLLAFQENGDAPELGLDEASLICRGRYDDAARIGAGRRRDSLFR